MDQGDGNMKLGRVDWTAAKTNLRRVLVADFGEGVASKFEIDGSPGEHHFLFLGLPHNDDLTVQLLLACHRAEHVIPSWPIMIYRLSSDGMRRGLVEVSSGMFTVLRADHVIRDTVLAAYKALGISDLFLPT